MIVAVRIEGNKTIPRQKIERHITTKAGRAFEAQTIENDIRALNKTRLFATVDPTYEQVEGGLVVVFRVVERPTLQYVIFHHSHVINERHLRKQAGLKKGDALDPYAIEEGRTKLEEYFHSKGYSKATTSIIEGTKPGDRGAQYLINEGLKQKIWAVHFEGNEIASDARLQTQIPAKPPILWVFKGEADKAKIDESVERLTDYYRSLGFFRARIGRELTYNERQNWLTVDFIIDEGPRYKVGEVSIIGNKKLPLAELTGDLKLGSGAVLRPGQNEPRRGHHPGQVRRGGLRVRGRQARPSIPRRARPARLDLSHRGRRAVSHRPHRREGQRRKSAHQTHGHLESADVPHGRDC